jgi:hypothetical protein
MSGPGEGPKCHPVVRYEGLDVNCGRGPGIVNRPVQRTITKIAYDVRSIEEIAAVLDSASRAAPFQLPGGEVFQIAIPAGNGPPTVMVTLWPTIHRVDAISPAATIVFTEVAMVELVEGVEVIFRRRTGEYLIVTRAGKVIVRS